MPKQYIMNEIDNCFSSNYSSDTENELKKLPTCIDVQDDIEHTLQNAIESMSALESEMDSTQTKELSDLCKKEILSKIEKEFGLAQVIAGVHKSVSEGKEENGSLNSESESDIEIVQQDSISVNDVQDYSDTTDTSNSKLGLKDAGKKIIYKSLGIAIGDFAKATMDELKYILNNWKGDSFHNLYMHFKQRMTEVATELQNKWKDIFKDSFKGVLPQILANLVVVIINFFAGTLKRLTDIIRKGFRSIYDAVKLLRNPRPGMSKEDIQHEVSKILVTGVITVLASSLEEVVEKGLLAIPGIQPFLLTPLPFSDKTIATAIAACVSLIIGGLASSVAIYCMDKWREKSKQNNLQIKIIAQSGVVLQCQVAKTAMVLQEGYNDFVRSAIRQTEMIKTVQDSIKTSSESVDKELDSWDDF